MAITYTMSYTFSPSTTISSSQVNTNFSDNSNTWNGIEAKTKTFSNLGVDTELKSGGSVLSANGTVAAPSFAFTNSTGTGLYRIGADNLGVATAGVIAMEITSAQAVRIKGTATNDSAAAGYVGEYITSGEVGPTTSTTGQYFDLTSITLGAGDWIVEGSIYFIATGNATLTRVGVSVTSGNNGTGLANAVTMSQVDLSNTGNFAQNSPLVRFSLAVSTIVYLKQFLTFTTGTTTGQGSIRGWRTR